MPKQIWFKCNKCGSKRFRIRMDHDWKTPIIDSETGKDNMQCDGDIECAKCGTIFLELGR